MRSDRKKRAFDVEQLLADYNRQINDNGKHAYSENLHNDDSSGCCLCDCLSSICNICSCCTLFSTGECCW